VSPENNGLYQSAETANDISSWKIAEEMQSGKFKSYMITRQKHPMECRRPCFISYETPKEKKSKFIIERDWVALCFGNILDNNRIIRATF
jgi:hypothetical protein